MVREWWETRNTALARLVGKAGAGVDTDVAGCTGVSFMSQLRGVQTGSEASQLWLADLSSFVKMHVLAHFSFHGEGFKTHYQILPFREIVAWNSFLRPFRKAFKLIRPFNAHGWCKYYLNESANFSISSFLFTIVHDIAAIGVEPPFHPTQNKF